MSEKNETKSIEEKIREILNGDAQKNALDFVVFLKANEISLDYDANKSEHWFGNGIGEDVGNGTGYLVITDNQNFPGPWTLWVNFCDFDGSDSADEEFKNAIWAFSSPCGRCNENWGKCRGSGKKTILGKEFENRCHSPLAFHNPDAKTVEHMKTFLLYLRDRPRIS